MDDDRLMLAEELWESTRAVVETVKSRAGAPPEPSDRDSKYNPVRRLDRLDALEDVLCTIWLEAIDQSTRALPLQMGERSVSVSSWRKISYPHLWPRRASRRLGHFRYQ
jgi:hypothetical protein